MKWTKASEGLPISYWTGPVRFGQKGDNWVYGIRTGVSIAQDLRRYPDMQWLDDSPDPSLIPDEQALKDEAEAEEIIGGIIYPHVEYEYRSVGRGCNHEGYILETYLGAIISELTKYCTEGRRKTAEQLQAKDAEIARLKDEIDLLFKYLPKEYQKAIVEGLSKNQQPS